MTVVAVCEAGGSSASTTTSLLLAALLPPAYPAFMSECDPSGGDVAAWAQLPVAPGWSTAISGSDRNWSAIVDHTQELPSGLRVMTAPARPSQARAAVIEAATGFAGLLGVMPDAIMIADCGRVELDAPVWARASQLTLLLLRQATVSAQATVARVDRTIEALEVLRCSCRQVERRNQRRCRWFPLRAATLMGSGLGRRRSHITFVRSSSRSRMRPSRSAIAAS